MSGKEYKPGGASGYCWKQHPSDARRCTLPVGHAGKHYHAYTKASW